MDEQLRLVSLSGHAKNLNIMKPLSVSRILLNSLVACLISCTANPSIRFLEREHCFRITQISAVSDKEIHFQFNDNIALFWRVNLPESYLRRNNSETIKIKTRPGYNEDGSKRGIDLYVERADQSSFASGRYSFHLVLDAAYPDYPNYNRRDVQSGTFKLNYGFF